MQQSTHTTLAEGRSRLGQRIRLIHVSAGLEAAGSGLRPTKEKWRAIVEAHGSWHGRSFASEAEAREHYGWLARPAEG